VKHRGSSKIKYEHHMIQGLRELLEQIEGWDEIRSIIPARIKPTKAPQPQIKLKVQHPTSTGLKCLARSGGAVQEVFIVSADPMKLQKKIEAL
jgi:hypothetical protein